MDLEWLIKFLHGLPHWNFHFQPVSAVFEPKRLEYLESIGLWAAGVLCVGGILLLGILISWCVRCCCTRPKEPAKRQKQIRSLSTGLFLVALAALAFLALGLFSNERANRGLSQVGDSLGDLGEDVRLAVTKIANLNRTLVVNATEVELTQLAALLRPATQSLNETEKERLAAVMKNVSEGLDSAAAEAGDLAEVLGRLDSVRPAANKLFRMENERWLTTAVLLSIALLVLFGGIVGLCRHSKKAAVVLSGLGLVLFALAWILAAAVAAAALALADFCADPQPFLLQQFQGNRSREMTKFFVTCHAAKEGSPELLPPPFLHSETEIKAAMAEVEAGLGSLDQLAKELFSKKLAASVAAAAKKITATLGEGRSDLTKTEQLLSCSGSLRRDYGDAEKGACEVGLSGAGLGFLALVLLGIFLGLLLVCLSRAWDLFTKRPMDYVEVEDEDPFLPRPHHDSTIPADFYGTHVYNPRTRFASTNDSETGAGGGLNGGGLSGGGPSGDGATPLWSRTAPPPPAYDVVHNGRFRHE